MFTLPNKTHLAFHPFFILALLAAFSLGSYLLASGITYRLGFPLDDAWIHQTYARNLVVNKEWSFIPGQPSAGSTAPLWSIMVAAGYLLGPVSHYWTYLLGWLLLLSVSILGELTFHQLLSIALGKDEKDSQSAKHNESSPPPFILKSFPVAGSLFILEWHLVWSAGSGMETLLFVLLGLTVIYLLMTNLAEKRKVNSHAINWFLIGGLIGLSIWVRPDGITLLAPAGLMLLLEKVGWKVYVWKIKQLGVGFLIVFVPYLFFNHILAGSWWPNTFYAKQAEYEVLRQLPFGIRLLQQASLPLVGIGAVLFAGFLLYFYRCIRQRTWIVLPGLIWVLGYLALYAWRLPVTYQHGRYLIPVMPLFFLWGLAGLVLWAQTDAPFYWRRVISRVWVISTGLVLLLFWGLGMRAYAMDVAVIESEMVDTALWLNAHTEPSALVAAHDIGALGYFGQRRLLDLAGLVSPEVIPFITDEQALRVYLDSQETDYLMTFPSWYPNLIDHAHPLFQTEGSFGPQLGYENMAVYSWDIR